MWKCLYLGKFVVNAGAPTVDDTSKVKVKVRVRLDMHGCFTVSSASMVETLPTPPTEPEKGKEEPMETTPASAESNEKQPMDTDSTSEGTTSDATTVSVNCTCF